MKHINAPVMLITFGLFMTEAMLHYNFGVKHNKPEEMKGKFIFPPKSDFLKIAGTVAIFSVANGLIVNKLLKA